MEKTKVNFAYSWHCYPFWRPYPVIISYCTDLKKPRKNQEVVVLQAEGIQGTRAKSAFTMSKSGDTTSLSYAVPRSSFACQSLLPSGCLCAFLDIWKLQSHPPFSCKTDPRTRRERAAAFLLNCNWTELKIEAELKLKRTQNPCRAPTRSVAASERQRDLQTRAGCHHGCVGHDSRCTAHGAWGHGDGGPRNTYFRDGLRCFMGWEGDETFYILP